mmetsp:Transcript_13631/g.27885  ORF Transcript_13631/g.27885 Transcript_13631/m.27885 type:complete len:82 (+) Transcript_13631:135-380(+)
MAGGDIAFVAMTTDKMDGKAARYTPSITPWGDLRARVDDEDEDERIFALLDVFESQFGPNLSGCPMLIVEKSSTRIVIALM